MGYIHTGIYWNKETKLKYQSDLSPVWLIRVFHKKTTSSSLIVKQWREAGYNLQLGNQPLRTSMYVRKDVNIVFNSWMAHTAVMTSICADRGQRSCRLSCCEQTGRGRQVCLRLGVKQKLHSQVQGGYS